jgi:hypothetical protein
MVMRSTLTTIGLVLALASAPVAAAESDDSQVPTAATRSTPVAARPGIVPSLYVSLAALQAYDGYSTLRAVGSGAREMNPVMSGAARRPAAMWTLKAASTAATIYYAEKLWRSHRRGQAIALLAVANGLMGAVAAHNASVLGSMR